MRNSTGIWFLVMPAVLVLPLATTSISVLVRWLPSRYHMEYSASLNRNLVRALETVAVLLIVNPFDLLRLAVASAFRARCCTPKGFYALLAVDICIVAAVPSFQGTLNGVVLFKVGSPVPELARSAVSQMVKKPHLGVLFAFLAILKQIRFVVMSVKINSPCQADLRDGGGTWFEKPYYFSAVLFVVMWLGCCWHIPDHLLRRRRRRWRRSRLGGRWYRL
ncbi:hypothetical protein BKA67DRAFT_304288 [Truncatella angustata]|uniref:Uncharacterized protein n=1 Tax=Truncatella angustata TaxID=152316 RepID=A0A9P8UIP5_9PEZI|nr:uncharacterized protein BKA67DRAFT_304288 [Truncatella angustata]KAH6652917.1 hypothetical protein BKA67DRAFT_304288 [Truncatella angustata]